MSFTRQDYLDNRCTHEQYHDQYVNLHVKNIVLGSIGQSNIVRSTDDAFNDIPLQQWDSLQSLIMGAVGRQRFRDLGDVPTINGCVCVLPRPQLDKSATQNCKPKPKETIMSNKTFKFSSAQRFRVVSGAASFYTTAGQIRKGLGDFTDFNFAARTALAALEASHPNSTGIAGRWSNADVQLDISR